MEEDHKQNSKQVGCACISSSLYAIIYLLFLSFNYICDFFSTIFVKIICLVALVEN